MSAIIGYRTLDQDTVDLINKIKLHGQLLSELVEETRLHILGQRAAAESMTDDARSAERQRLKFGEPERWAALAKTDLQKGVMFLVRACAQPGGF